MLGVDGVNGAAVGHVDAQADVGPVGDEGVRPGNRAAGVRVHNGHAVAVDLFGGDEGHVAEAEIVAGLLVVFGKARQSGFAVGCDVEFRDAPDERVAELPSDGDCRKRFNHDAHRLFHTAFPGDFQTGKTALRFPGWHLYPANTAAMVTLSCFGLFSAVMAAKIPRINWGAVMLWLSAR